MIDSTADGELPTPAQMRSFLGASRAAWQARRMREASHAVVAGNVAAALCLVGIMLVVIHAEALAYPPPPFVAAGLGCACLAIMGASIRWGARGRARGGVTVVDRREEQLRSAPAPRRKMAAIFAAIMAFQAACVAGWMFAFPRMSEPAMPAVIAAGPVAGVLFFARRFVLFRFWEDLLFAGSILLAWAPFFFKGWSWAPLSLLSLPLVILGVACLHLRWATWTRSLAEVEEPQE